MTLEYLLGPYWLQKAPRQVCACIYDEHAKLMVINRLNKYPTPNNLTDSNQPSPTNRGRNTP